MYFSIAVLILLSTVSITAQTANFEAAEKFSAANLRKMVGDLTVRPNWLENSDTFWYSYKTGEGKNYYIVDSARKSKTLMFDREYLASELTKQMNKPVNAKDLPITELEFSDDRRTISFKVDTLNFDFNLNSNVLTKKESEKSPRTARWKNFSPDSSYVVFAKAHNLFVMKADDPDSVEIQLTTDGEKWYSFNANDSDTSSTKRLRANANWFKDSKKLYVQRTDRRKVGELWVISSTADPRPTLETFKYPLPGEENVPQDELCILNAETKSRLDIDVSKWKDQSIDRVTFAGNRSDILYFTRRSRPYDKVDVCEVNAESGDVRTLISEESEPYFHSMYHRFACINDGQELIWKSERDGWGHLYLYDGDGNLKNRITEGAFTVNNIAKIDTAARTIYFDGYGKNTEIDPYYAMYYSVKFDGSGLKLLTPEDATHSFSMPESRRFFVDTYSRVDQVQKSVLRDSNGNVVLELETPDISRLEESGWKAPERIKTKAADGVTDIYGVMWKPFDFDPEKKYPIISYCYPGPQANPVQTTFFQIRNERVHTSTLAQLGFIVVSLGQRGGSPLRSRYYHTYGYGNARDYPLDDNKAALEQLAAKHSYIDIDKVGIYGRSGGGFMSTAAMLVYPDFYKVAVSQCGNHDNNIYNMWWGEAHYGVEEVEKDSTISFKSEIPTNQALAKNLKGHLLLLHGEIDNNVHPANTIRVADELIKANKRFDFMIIPGKRHTFGNYIDYIDHMMRFYFAEHLLGDYRANVDIKNYDKK